MTLTPATQLAAATAIAALVPAEHYRRVVSHTGMNGGYENAARFIREFLRGISTQAAAA